MGGARWPSAPHPPARQAWILPGGWVRHARLCEVGGPASMINIPQCVLMCFCKSSVCVQLKSQYACVPHPPTRWDPSPPGSWVRCAGSARPTHPLGRQIPAAGCCPCRAETNYPSVINQLRPLQCMTEATLMSKPGLISFVFSWRHNF